jgi:hypothetical protein
MGVQPSEAKRLSLYEYQAILFRWEEAHRTDEQVEPPSVDEAMEMFAHADRIGLVN